MKKTGELLRKAREEKGLSLNEIGLSLKINNKILKAIEEGDEANLPAKTFLRGFVKSYATFLRMDVDSVLQTFQEEMGSTKPQPYIRPVGDSKSSETETSSTTDDETASAEEPASSTQATVTELPRADKYAPLQEKKSTRIIIISFIVIALFGLIVFTKKMIDKYSKEAEVPVVEIDKNIEAIPEETTENEGEVETPVENPQEKSQEAETATPAASPLPALTNIVKPTPTSAPISTPTPTATPTPSPSPSPIATPTPKPTPEPSPSPSPSPTPTPTPTPSPTPVATPTPSPTPAADVAGKPVELIVEALDVVEIEYSAPNGKPQKIKLSADQVHTFKSKSGLKIGFSNGGAVNLILNGRDIGIPGDLGKPIKLSY